MKLGIICRMDNSGLGSLSWEFARNLKPHKVLLVENFVHTTFPERYASFDSRRAGKSYSDNLEWFLEDVDVVLSFETFYRWEIVKICRAKGIKTVLYTMYEMSSWPLQLMPDMLLCPSTLDYEVFSGLVGSASYYGQTEITREDLQCGYPACRRFCDGHLHREKYSDQVLSPSLEYALGHTFRFRLSDVEGRRFFDTHYGRQHHPSNSGSSPQKKGFFSVLPTDFPSETAYKINDTLIHGKPQVVLIPVPVATDRLLWNERKTAHTFIHSASHGGMSGRKGTQLFLDAIPMVKSDVKFIIYSWRPFESNDPRLEVKVQNFKNYWQMWREGDVLVYPQDYNGICLPIIEAMTSGLGVITTDIYPFNEYMPKELLFKPRSMYKTRAAPSLMETDAARIDPRDIAAKIDEWANRDISRFSKYGKEWGEQNNWETLGPKIAETLENLVSA